MIATGGLVVTNALRNWARVLINWNVVLDESGTPKIGPFHAPGIITIVSKSKELSRRTNYWLLKHFTHAARWGRQRRRFPCAIDKIAHVTFVNRDGGKSPVLSNTGTDRKVQVRAGNLRTEAILPANSMGNLS